MMGDAKSKIIVATLAMVPYLVVTWGYTVFTSGGARTFWTALGVLLGVRLFFSVIEGVGSVLAWKLHGRKVAVGIFLRWLRANNFPQRYYRRDDFSNYLDRIENDETSPPSLKQEAKQMYAVLGMVEELVILAGVRMHAASEIALEMYSPGANATR